jgi:hypothetical protein
MTNPEPSAPWWRFPIVWMALGGPAAVVVASLATAVLAVRGGDVPLHDGNDTTQARTAPQAGTMTPATLARNHAATTRR